MFELSTSAPAATKSPPEGGTTDIVDLSRRHLSPALARYYERAWSHGEGHRLYDVDGRAYLDFATGIATTILGHRHPRVTQAITDQAERLLHVCNGLGHLEPVSRLAEMIAATMPAPLDTVFFGNSGAEVIEGALKLARRATGRSAIICFEGAFHGRTFGALSVTTSNPNYQAGHGPLLPDVHVLPYPDAQRHAGNEGAAMKASLDAIEQLLAAHVPAERVAAVIIEPILGEGGYVPAPDAFLRRLRELCDQHGIVLVFDEVQSGYGRTGRMWAFEHAGVVPDIVCMAKGIANGMPLGAFVASRALHERWGLGAHGTTFGGNPVSCAAGIAVLETIQQEGLVANAAARGSELLDGLRRIAETEPRVGAVRGRGLMLGVPLVHADSGQPDGALANAAIARCADDGLLVLTCGPAHDVIRWLPPLDVTAAEIHEGLQIFGRALGAV
ncbi:MAG TPA: aminotransferase class III-fold pyridoxal phosphate-dependent enzyme [Candidatus Limnocylindrales bacterium]|nr:aminotransferase class III-fold pyridoxal phosphate-dependent enzyme [Candidatus Limnocylindrales bacterium]